MGMSLLGAVFSTSTRASAKLASKELAPIVDITNAPIEALVEGMQMSFRVVALIVTASAILAASLWWLEYSKTQISSEPETTQTPS